VSIRVSYRLTGSGWSECNIVIDEHQATITASYLSDALGDLLGAVSRIVEGVTEATASFAEEPGEYRCRFFRKGPDRLLVRILEFPQLWGNRPDEEGKVVLDAECRIRTFAGAVLSASQQLLEESGMEGYRNMWGQHDFPLEQQEKLRNLLRQCAE
jgi:hypothetical protein